MGTDYQAKGFSKRYVLHRRLTASSQALWVKTLASLVTSDDVTTVLDLGAGAGRFWPVFIDAWNPDLVVAADASSSMLSAADGPANVVRIVADMNALPLSDNAFDVCFCSMVLHHSSSPGLVLTRIRAVLRPGGTLLVRTGTDSTLESFDFLRYFPTAMRAEGNALPTMASVHEWLREAGFDEVFTQEIKALPAASRREQLRRLAGRGFPSLQLVSRREFHAGLTRYFLRSVIDHFCGIPLVEERVALISARVSRPIA